MAESTGWTPDTLFKHVDIRFDALQRYIDARFLAADNAVAIQATNLENRLDKLNELRSMVADAQAKFLTISTYDVQHSGMAEQLRAIERTITAQIAAAEKSLQQQITTDGGRLSTLEGKGLGTAQLLTWILAAVAIIATVSSVLLNVLQHLPLLK
jgi:hypothetical protein